MVIRNLENNNRKFVNTLQNFHVLEYERDSSVSPYNAVDEYFMSKMNVRRRQVVVELGGGNAVAVQAGEMQWMAGDIKAGTGVKGVGDFLGKALKSVVTKETAVKPEYAGEGIIVLEPTYKYILLIDVADWGQKGMTVEDGMFIACDNKVQRNVAARKSFSSAILGGEGLFSLSLAGHGVVALESNVPQEELIEVELQDDELKIDGDLAVCWSTGLEFTVERTTKRLVGSAVSGEGLVNVYRGTGRVLMCPVASTDTLDDSTGDMDAKAADPDSNTYDDEY